METRLGAQIEQKFEVLERRMVQRATLQKQERFYPGALAIALQSFSRARSGPAFVNTPPKINQKLSDFLAQVNETLTGAHLDHITAKMLEEHLRRMQRLKILSSCTINGETVTLVLGEHHLQQLSSLRREFDEMVKHSIILLNSRLLLSKIHLGEDVPKPQLLA